MYDDDYAFFRRLCLGPGIGIIISLLFPIDRLCLIKSAFDFKGNHDGPAFLCFCAIGLYVLSVILSGFARASEKRKIYHSHFELFGHVFWDTDLPAEDPYARAGNEIAQMLFDDFTIPITSISHFCAMMLGVNMGDREYSESGDDRFAAIFDLAKMVLSVLLIIIVAKKFISDYGV